MRYAKEILLLAALASLISLVMVTAEPTGPDTLDIGANARMTDMYTKNAEALAGNVTELTFTGRSVTKYWQGYYGNISGNIVLSDANNNSLYRWVDLEPVGEVYASRWQDINWSNVRCMSPEEVNNEDIYFLGLNQSGDRDAVNNTFIRSTYRSFYTGFLNFTTGSCKSTSVNNTGSADIFNEVLQMDSTEAANKTIFTAIIDQNIAGFDGDVHDFQMIVTEPGAGNETYPHGTTTTYYFWLELGS